MTRLSKKFQNNQNLLISVLLVLGILVLVNMLSDRLFWRWDLTADKLYSTAPVTKQTLASLPDPVTVRIYFSPNLPSQFNLTRRQLDDLLADYSVYGRKLNYQFIDPGDGREAEKLGMPKLQFNDIRHDKLEVVTGYMGMVINYRDQQEVIPVLQDAGLLEYQLTSLLKKMLSGKQPTVGFLRNYSTVSLDKDLKALRQSLTPIYQLEDVDLAKAVPANIQTLVIAGVKADLREDELKNLDKFLMANGSLIVLHDGASTVTTPVNFNVTNKSNLNGLLAKYGLSVGDNLVADVYSGVAAFNQGVTMFNVSYPLWPKILRANMETSNPSVANLDGVILPWASSLVIDRAKINPEAKVSELVKTSAQAWLMPSDTNVNPAEIIRPTDKRGQFVLAAGVQGKIKSAYGQGESQQAQLIVIGDSDFIRDEFVSGANANLVLMKNLIDGASLDPELAQISSKQIKVRAIAQLSDNAKQWFSWLNIWRDWLLVMLS
jgi:ABC-type uncharacterized transport system involved in gliding motility auxiliary subunit